jgi:hypothetical protein
VHKKKWAQNAQKKSKNGQKGAFLTTVPMA